MIHSLIHDVFFKGYFNIIESKLTINMSIYIFKGKYCEILNSKLLAQPKQKLIYLIIKDNNKKFTVCYFRSERFSSLTIKSLKNQLLMVVAKFKNFKPDNGYFCTSFCWINTLNFIPISTNSL